MQTARTRSNDDPSVIVDLADRAGPSITIRGDVDVTSERLLRDGVAEALDAGHERLVIDLSEATFIDTGAYGVLVEALTPLRLVETSSVIFVGVHGCVLRVLQLLEADRMFDRPDGPTTPRRARTRSTEPAWITEA